MELVQKLSGSNLNMNDRRSYCAHEQLLLTAPVTKNVSYVSVLKQVLSKMAKLGLCYALIQFDE